MATMLAQSFALLGDRASGPLRTILHGSRHRLSELLQRAQLSRRHRITHTSVLTDGLERDYYATSPRYEI